MHTTSYKYQADILTDAKVIFHHNGDFSGDVTIHFLEDVDIEDIEGIDFEDVKTLKIPFEAIKYLVSEYIRSKKIQKIENANINELLGL